MRRRNLLLATLVAMSISACKTLSLLGGGDNIVKIVTDPPGALVTVEQYGECISPCTIGLDAPRAVKITKDGYVEQTITVKPHSRTVKLKLELAAASTDIDTGSLPDI